ncbi:MAG: NADP(H)-dependent aldo-keto reductase [Cytophagaceae bacterium]
MEYSKLGNTDLEVSRICLGTMTYGEQNTLNEAHEQLNCAFEQGINFIDAAEMYPVPGRKETQGSTEKIVGEWLKSQKREKIILATKVTGPNKGLSYIRGGPNFSKTHILEAIEGSLKRLQTDYIDLYQLHWPERKTNYFGRLGYIHDKNDPWEDNFFSILEVLQDLKKQGKIRHFGISNETPWGLMHFLHLGEKHNLPRCQSIQNPYSLLNRTFEVGLSEISIREQVGLLAYSPLAFGVLTGKYIGHKPEKSRLALFPQMSRYSNEQADKATRLYVQLAKERSISPVQLALSFINTRPFVTSTIIGATTMAQLQENIESINYKADNDLLQAIEAINSKFPNPAP